MNKEELVLKLKQIATKGFIENQFKRNRNGGAGNTLEKLLGVKENNLSIPDLGKIELKTTNSETSGGRLISLLNFNRKVWKMNQLEAINKYGSKNQDGRLGLYYTLNTKPNSHSLFIKLNINEGKMYVQSTDGNVLIEYLVDNIVEKFNIKVRTIMLVYFKTKIINKTKLFHYYKARFLKGGSTRNKIMEGISSHLITIDLRLHSKKTKDNFVSRNHGTAFRVKEKNLFKLYKYDEMIDLMIIK